MTLPDIFHPPGALIGILTIAAGLAFPAIAQESGQEVTFVSGEGEETGTATLIPSPSGLLITLEVAGLPAESWHGFHIHETGECDWEGAFDSAGGHFAPDGAEHGFKVEGGPHVGDMPNQYVGADGTLRAEILNTRATLGDGGAADVSGQALMIHSDADDYESQPSGDSGDRIACAVIE